MRLLFVQTTHTWSSLLLQFSKGISDPKQNQTQLVITFSDQLYVTFLCVIFCHLFYVFSQAFFGQCSANSIQLELPFFWGFFGIFAWVFSRFCLSFEFFPSFFWESFKKVPIVCHFWKHLEFKMVFLGVNLRFFPKSSPQPVMSQLYPVPIPLPQPKSRPLPDSRGIPDTLNGWVGLSRPLGGKMTSTPKSKMISTNFYSEWNNLDHRFQFNK